MLYVLTIMTVNLINTHGRSINDNRSSPSPNSINHHHHGISNLWDRIKNDIEEVLHPGKKEEFAHIQEICGTRPSYNEVPSPRIAGGSASKKGQFPWQVLLHNIKSNAFFCGGTLISSRAVLSAAHCLNKIPAEHIKVYAGKVTSIIQNQEPNQQEFRVNSYALHPGYNDKKLHDVAILYIAPAYGSRVKWSDWVLPVCLPFASLDIEEGSRATVSGYGTVGGPVLVKSPVLLSVDVPIYEHMDCSNKYTAAGYTRHSGVVITEDHICAGGEKGKDACAGDSGGPLVLQDAKTGRFILVGIVSYGLSCHSDLSGTLPGVYAKTEKYIPWILNQVSKIEGTKMLSSNADGLSNRRCCLVLYLGFILLLLV